MRQIEGAQRVELRYREADAEILAGLAHARGDRAAPLHDRQRVDGAIRPRRPAGGIGDRLREALDWAVALAFRGRALLAGCPLFKALGGALGHENIS